MQCNTLLSLPFGVGKNSSWVRVYMWLQRERERERETVSGKGSLCLSRTSLFFPLLPLLPVLCLFGRDTHTHTSVSRGNFFFQKMQFRCNSVFRSVIGRGKKRVLDYSFPFLLLLLFSFRFRDEKRKATKSCCSAARTRMVV